MDEATLRKQITELQDQFDTQLRELRREKMHIEEELDTASQKWRSERRRLNAEIERLEEALLSKNPAAANPAEFQDAVEEQVRQASSAWAAERQQLKNEIARLELAVTEAISRSNNPMRSTQQLKDKFEFKLSEAEALHLRIEREFLAAKSSWDEEKKKLLAELMKLRRMVPTGGVQLKEVMDRMHSRTDTLEETRIRELEIQLAESRASVLQYHERVLKAAQELASAKREIQESNQALSQLREEVNSGSLAQLKQEHAANIEDLIQKNEQLANALQQAPPVAVPESSDTRPLQWAPPEGGGPVDEIARTRKSIDDIEKIMDDPDTSASTIARKNIEKRELEAYLRGLLFSSARAQGS